MIAYASLHTEKPTAQNEHEANYKGYHRVPVEYTEDFGNVPVTLQFPAIEETTEGEITHICIGTAEVGNGDALLVIHSMPYIKMEKTANRVPTISIINEPNFPEGINPIAEVAYRLWWQKKIKAEDLHPALYESINMELQRVAMPVIPVVRGAAAAWDIKMQDLRLGDWG